MPTSCIPRHNATKLAITAVLLVLALIASISFGATQLSLSEAVRDLLNQNVTSPAARILLHVRLPRTLAALLCGAALAVSGVLLQGVLNNALAGPNIIGVNAGAGFAVLLASTLVPAAAFLPAAAFVGALCA
ncbi:MAG: iron chelate uptake ABC transporter family permease subunit, partial [Pygmaiobacter sp.]